jgi:hypothetical protein
MTAIADEHNLSDHRASWLLPNCIIRAKVTQGNPALNSVD